MEEFIKFLAKDSKGYLGAAYRKDAKWLNKFYKTPTEIDKLIQDATEADSKGWDCYIVPAILKEKSRRKYSFKESNVAWVDYDGDEPVIFEPTPSVVVETSPNHYHAYWAFSEPATASQVELTNQALYLNHGADNSGWDCTQLLRLPGTLSKKRGVPVEIVARNENVEYGIYDLPKTWDLHLHVK